MNIFDKQVSLCRCPQYDRRLLLESIDQICSSLDIVISAGSHILLKPNLVSGRGHDGLACTHPEFVAAVAEWFLEQGARVLIGDSPAFGSCRRVMDFCGITQALEGLPVQVVEFSRGQSQRLACSLRVGIAPQVFDCDVLINLPKVKAHGQLRMSLAVKNFFGVVSGWKKARLHMSCGEKGNLFEAVIVDLLALLPPGLSFADGIRAMHETGPIAGTAYPLGLVAGSVNPVALDTGMLDLLDVDIAHCPIALECARRGFVGSDSTSLVYPLLAARECRVQDFQVPTVLQKVRFQPARMVKSSLKKVILKWLPI